MTMTATTRWASASLLCSMNINAYPRKGPCEKWPGNKCWAGFFALHTKIVWDLPCMGKTGALSEQREIGILETTLCATSHLTHFLTCRHLSFFRHRTAENASFLSPHRRERGEARHWDSPPHRFPATRTTIRPIFSRYFRFHSSNPSQWNDLPPTPNDLPAEWRRKTGHIIPSMRDAVRIRHPKACGTPHRMLWDSTLFGNQAPAQAAARAERAQHRPQLRMRHSIGHAFLPFGYRSSIVPRSILSDTNRARAISGLSKSEVKCIVRIGGHKLLVKLRPQ